MVGLDSDDDEQKKYNKALEDYATAIETRAFISKKTFYLRYKTEYGASHKEAEDFIWI